MYDAYRTLVFPVVLFLLLAMVVPLSVQATPKVNESALIADRHHRGGGGFGWGGGYSRGWDSRRVVYPVYYDRYYYPDYYPTYYYQPTYYYSDPYYYYPYSNSSFYLNFRVN